MENIKVKCNCGKLAIEVDWEDEALMDMLFEQFGPLDDYYFFICECGEVTRMHYTGYDCLLDDLEFSEGFNSNEDSKILFECGYFVVDTKSKNLDLSDYKEFHKFESGNEVHKLMRNGFEFAKVEYSLVHKETYVSRFVCNEENVVDLYNHFAH